MDFGIDPLTLIAILIAYLFFRCSLKPEKYPPGIFFKLDYFFLLKIKYYQVKIYFLNYTNYNLSILHLFDRL